MDLKAQLALAQAKHAAEMAAVEAAATDAAHRSQNNVTALEVAARTAGEEASAQLQEAKAAPCTLNPEPPILHPEPLTLNPEP